MKGMAITVAVAVAVLAVAEAAQLPPVLLQWSPRK
jgi:hypothetical protein